MLANNVGLITPVNYYEDNYPCKISISCQCTIVIVFIILDTISLIVSLTSLYYLFYGLISVAILYLLYKNLRSVKEKYEKNIHPCPEKTNIKIISGIITGLYGIQIIGILIIALSIDKDMIDDLISGSFESNSLEDIANIAKVIFFILLFLAFIPFVLFLLIFINSLHIN